MATHRTVLGEEKEVAEPVSESLKAVILGPVKSGKSALFKRIMGGDFEEGYTATSGVDYGSKNYELTASSIAKLQLWDTAGEDHYRPILRTYYQGAQLAIFTLNGNQKLSEQREQLVEENDKLQAVNKNALRVLVVTKKDLEQKITKEELAELKMEMDISEQVFSSAKDKESDDFDAFLFEQIQAVLHRRQTRQRAAVLQESKSKSTHLNKLKEKFAQALSLVEQGGVLKNAATQEAGQRFLKELTALKETTLNDLQAKKLSIKEAAQLAESAQTLAARVATLTATPEDLKTFHTATEPNKKTSLLGKVLGAVLGAALGVVVGVMVGMAAGPVAALTALYGGIQGAVIGASVGGAVLGAAGVWCSMWVMKQNHPATRLEAAAKAVVDLSPSVGSRS